MSPSELRRMTVDVVVILAGVTVSAAVIYVTHPTDKQKAVEAPVPTQPAFVRTGDACADLPRLVAAYKAEHERLKARGSFREEERALLDATLRDTGALAEECSRERQSDRDTFESSTYTLWWLLAQGRISVLPDQCIVGQGEGAAPDDGGPGK